MKKSVVCAALAASMLFTLCGCGRIMVSDKTDTAPAETAAPVYIPNDDLKNEIEALMNDIYDAAPGTAGSSLRAAAAAAKLMDFAEKYKGDFDPVRLGAVIRNWFTGRFAGDAAYEAMFIESLNAVGGRVEDFLNGINRMEGELSDAGYTRIYEAYTPEYARYVLDCIAGAFDKA